MNKWRIFVIQITQQQKWFLAFMAIYLAWVFTFYDDYPMALEEPVDYNFGIQMYNRTFGRDPILLKDFAQEGEGNREIWAYNHFHSMWLYVFNDSGSLEGFHFNNFIFSLIAFFICYQIMLLATRKPGLALIGPIFLFFTPRYLGNIASNVKDPVFATYYLFALWVLMISHKLKKWWLKSIVLGVSYGMSAAIRTVGYNLLLVHLVVRLIEAIKSHSPNPKVLVRGLSEIVVIFVCMVLIHAIQMPFVKSNPVAHLPRLFQMAKEYPWTGLILYAGKEVSAGQLPWDYIPIWFGISTPLMILVLWLLSHWFVKTNRLLMILHISFWTNIALYYLLDPIVYDGIRHLLFLSVIMTVIASVTFAQLWLISITKIKRLILLTFLGFQLLLVGTNYIALHPYQYLYFNELIGFLPGAFNRFETDYWALSFAEGIKWLKENEARTAGVRVGLCTHFYAKSYLDEAGFESVWLPDCVNIEQSEVKYVLSSSRNNEWDKVNDEEIYAVKRMGVPLMKIFRID